MSDEKSIRYYLFQLKENSDKSEKLLFVNADYLKKTGQTVSGNNYDLVYMGSLRRKEQTTGEILESLYERFNLHHPDDFRGRSLSVSDVIVLREDGRNHAYFVDSFGFKQVPEFFADDPLHKVEELLEDDYDMIDGLINNGPKKDEKEENRRISVIEKLHEKQAQASIMDQVLKLPDKDRARDRDLS